MEAMIEARHTRAWPDNGGDGGEHYVGTIPYPLSADPVNPPHAWADVWVGRPFPEGACYLTLVTSADERSNIWSLINDTDRKGTGWTRTDRDAWEAAIVWLSQPHVQTMILMRDCLSIVDMDAMRDSLADAVRRFGLECFVEEVPDE